MRALLLCRSLGLALLQLLREQLLLLAIPVLLRGGVAAQVHSGLHFHVILAQRDCWHLGSCSCSQHPGGGPGPLEPLQKGAAAAALGLMPWGRAGAGASNMLVGPLWVYTRTAGSMDERAAAGFQQLVLPC